MFETRTSAATRDPSVTRQDPATRRTVQVLGLLAALAGVEHGIGEVAQGWVAPESVVFESWPHTRGFEPLDGEPAMSLVSNLWVSGVLSIAVASALGLATLRAGRVHAGVIIGLSVVLLLVGGGFGPPVLGVATGLLARRLGTAPSRRPGRLSRAAARTYPWPLVGAAACFVGLVPGTALVRLVVDGDLALLVGILGLGAFAGTAWAMWSARARDRLGAARPTPSGLP